MKVKGYRFPRIFFYAGLVCIYAFGLLTISSCRTVPHELAERFDSKQIKSFRVYVVVDPDSKRSDWKKQYGTVFNEALADHLKQKGYIVEDIYAMRYIEARGVFGSTYRFPYNDENYGQWLASLGLQKNISAVIVTYIQFQHYYSGVKVDWLSEMSIGYCVISATSGKKIFCSDFQTFMNTEKGERTYVGTTSIMNKRTEKYPFGLHQKKENHFFIKESVEEIFKDLPSAE